MISSRKQGKAAARPRVARAFEDVLRMYADPVRRRLKVRTALKAGGLCLGCGGNHNRRALVVA